MKKVLIVGFLLVLMLSMALVACGGEEATTTTAAPATDTTAAAASIVFKMASTYQENESGGKIVQHFADYIKEKTNGAVTIEVFPGGTLGGPMESLDLVSSGSVDIVPLGHPPLADKLPLLNFPMFAPGSPQAAVDYFNELAFVNPETSAMIQTEAEKNNVKYLGFTSGGSNVFISKSAFTKLSDLVGKKFGAGGSIPAFEALGYTIVQMFPPDGYENLSRGVVDATQMGFVPTVNMKWYEPAKFYMFDGTYAAGNPWSVNLKSWAKLSPEQQQVFMDAAKDAETFSLELDKTDTVAAVDMLKAAGVTVGDLTAEDKAQWYQLLFEASAADCMTRAEKLGITDQMVKVLTVAAAKAGVTWTPPAK